MSSTACAPFCALQSSIMCRSDGSGDPPVTLYQPKAFWKRALARVTTVNDSGQVGRKVCGVTAASLRGSIPDRLDGMQVLSLNVCHIVVSHVPCWPLSQLD